MKNHTDAGSAVPQEDTKSPKPSAVRKEKLALALRRNLARRKSAVREPAPGSDT